MSAIYNLHKRHGKPGFQGLIFVWRLYATFIFLKMSFIVHGLIYDVLYTIL